MTLDVCYYLKHGHPPPILSTPTVAWRWRPSTPPAPSTSSWGADAQTSPWRSSTAPHAATPTPRSGWRRSSSTSTARWHSSGRRPFLPSSGERVASSLPEEPTDHLGRVCFCGKSGALSTAGQWLVCGWNGLRIKKAKERDGMGGRRPSQALRCGRRGPPPCWTPCRSPPRVTAAATERRRCSAHAPSGPASGRWMVLKGSPPPEVHPENAAWGI